MTGAVPGWVHDVIWWQVYPLGFVGAEREATPVLTHRLGHLERWLDYAVELGTNGLALGPVFASETHGYDTVDHFRVDPRLGDDADFDALVAAAHSRGMRVLLDGVFNHVGRGHPAFQEVLRDGPDASTASWFRLDWAPDAKPGDEPGYADFEGHHALVALNHDEPAVADYVARVMLHWLERGADGWRLDAAYAVPPHFWRPVLERVRAAYPEVYVVGEVIHGDYAQTVTESGLDAVTQYELWKAVPNSLNTVNFFELAWTLKRHNGFLDTFAPLTFLGNHDVTRIASALTDIRHLPLALAVLLTVGGTPTIYYGDEQAYRGVKQERMGGDDDVRPLFPDDPSQLSALGADTFRLHEELIGLRRRHRWLHEARTREVHLTNEQLTYVSELGDQRLVVALNLGSTPVDQPAPYASQVLAGSAILSGSGESTTARVAAPGFAILDVAAPA